LPRPTAALCLSAALIALASVSRAARAEPPPPAPAPAPLAVPAEPSECNRRLEEFAAFARLPPIAGPGECGGEDLVRLEAVIMPDRARVALAPPATLRCGMAEAVAQFVRMEAGPAVEDALGARLDAVATAASYHCRNRNNEATARISEHARANAVDVGALRLAGRAPLALTDPAAPPALRERLRDAACRWFTTVLGPGSDGMHEAHVHLDRAERARGHRLCQWDVRQPADPTAVPLPRPKPFVSLRPSAIPAGNSARAK
jgi:hypothetical protein